MGNIAHKQQRVIILGSNPATRLGLIRSIGELGEYEIYIVQLMTQLPKREYRPADSYSKYVTKCVTAKKYDAEYLYRVLVSECMQDDCKAVIISVDDDSACLVDEIQDRLEQYFICANVNGKVGEIGRLMDKSVQKALAEEAGFRVTQSWILECEDGRYEIPEDIVFPCYVKGLISYYSMKKFQGRCDSREELEQTLKRVASACSYPMLVEEFLEIENDLGVIGYCERGASVIPGIVELLESGYGDHKGVSIYGKVRKEREGEEIISRVAAMMKKVGLTGLFNIDLVVCHGDIYFVELNLRYAAYGYAVSKAGVNLPAYFVKSAFGECISELRYKIDADRYYMNEKVAIDDFMGGHRSLKNVCELRKQVDFGLVKDVHDNRPYRMLWCDAIRIWCKQKAKKALGKS